MPETTALVVRNSGAAAGYARGTQNRLGSAEPTLRRGAQEVGADHPAEPAFPVATRDPERRHIDAGSEGSLQESVLKRAKLLHKVVAARSRRQLSKSSYGSASGQESDCI